MSLNIFRNRTAQVTVINNVNSETSLNFSLNHDLDNLKVWLDSNGLNPNVLKTKCLFTGTTHKISLLPSEFHICFDGYSVERVVTYKCLGVQVEETLS